MYVFSSARRGWRGGEWMRGLGLGFTNPVGTYGDCCMCVRVLVAVVWVVWGGVGGVGGVGGEWVGEFDQSLEGWGCVMFV